MTLHSPEPESPPPDKPQRTPESPFRWGMDLEHGTELSETRAFSAWLEIPSPPATQTRAPRNCRTLFRSHGSHTQKNKPRRRSCEVWVSFIDSGLHTSAFKAQAQRRGQSRSRARRQNARPWQARPAHRMQSFTMELRRAFEAEVGGGEEVFPGLTSRPRPPLPLAKSISAQEPRGQQIQPTHLHRADPSIQAAHTPASAGPRVRESASRSETERFLSDPPSTSSAGSAQELLEDGGQRAGFRRVASSNPGTCRAAGYRFTQADHCFPSPSHTPPALLPPTATA